MGRVEKTGVDFRRLRYFVAVCDHGGFSKAAKVIGVAQPALTRQMQLLEQDLGLALFTRNGRSAAPTEPAALLLGQVRAHLDSLDAAIDRLKREFSGASAQITLGISPTIAPLFLDYLQESMRLETPAPTLAVIEAYSGDLRNLMAAGRIDLALSYWPLDLTGLIATKLVHERLVLAASSAPECERLTLSDVARMRLILPSRLHQLRRIIDHVAEQRGVALVPVLELDSLSAVKLMLDDRRGGYATILPYHSVAKDAGQGRFTITPFDDPDMYRTIALLRPETSQRPVPASLTDHVIARANAIRQSLEAVF